MKIIDMSEFIAYFILPKEYVIMLSFGVWFFLWSRMPSSKWLTSSGYLRKRAPMSQDIRNIKGKCVANF